MYPFYVNGKKIFSFSYKPSEGDIVRYDKTGEWFKVTDVGKGKSRKIIGRSTVKPEYIY